MTHASVPPEQTGASGPQTYARPGLRTLIARFPVTYILIGITSMIYLAQEVSGLLLGGDIVISYGAKINEAIYAGELWRFVTPIFVHAGIWHIFVNMYSLYAIGPTVEGFFKSQRMFVIYIFSGISGVIFSLAFSPNPSVGASGAIFGLLGSLGTFLFLHRESLGERGKAFLRRIAMVAILNLGLGLSPGIDNWGHLGGLLAGCALTWFLGPKFELSWTSGAENSKLIELRPWNEIWIRVFPAATVILFLAYIALQNPFTR